MGRAFANGPGELGLIPGLVITKTLKMVLDPSLLSTQQYKVRIEGKVEQSWEKSSALPPLHLCVVATEKGASWSPSTTHTNLTYTVKCNYFYLLIVIRLPTIIWFQVFLSSANNF